MSTIIRNSTKQDSTILADIIRKSFIDVAERFNLTIENAPSHPSHCTEEWIINAISKGVKYYILENEAIPCGCVALERVNDEVGYLERLGVLPRYRNRSFGNMLVNHVISEARKLKLKRIEIGIIAEDLILKNWYRKQGFMERNRADYEHLPFTVLFMYKPV